MEIKLYMYVTNDEYELPLCVSEYPEVVAEAAGTSKNCVFCEISRHEKGLKSRFRKVIVNRNEIEDIREVVLYE